MVYTHEKFALHFPDKRVRDIARATRKAMNAKGIDTSKYNSRRAERWAFKHVKAVLAAYDELQKAGDI